MVKAVKENFSNFLYCVYAFNMNYEKVPEKDQIQDSENEEIEEIKNEEINILKNYQTFTYDYLFQLILNNCEEEAKYRIWIVAEWGLKSKRENIL